MRKIFAVLIFTAIFFVGCDYGYGNDGNLPEGQHDSASEYNWHASYDDGTFVRDYYTDSQPVFNASNSNLELMNVREGRGAQLSGNVYLELSFLVDELVIIQVSRQPIRSDTANLDDFEWRVVFTDASGLRREFYLHHQPEEAWFQNDAVRILKMVRGYSRTGAGATGWSFSEYYIAGPAKFFLVEQKPSQGWD